MRFGGIVLATALALGACTSDPAPREPVASTPTTAPTPTMAVPTPPDQASEDSPEGAAAFVKHYVNVFNYAAATGDVDELTRLSAPTCKGCQSYIDLYEQTYKAGGYFRGGDWKIGDIRMQPDGDDFYLTVPVEVGRGTFRESAQSNEYEDSGESSTVSFALRRTSEWRVTQMGLGDVE